MEREIGEIFEHEGEWYQCVRLDDNSCGQCDMYNHGRCPISARECFACGRSDRTSFVFRRLEKVGEPFKELNHSTNKYVFLQEYKLFDPHAFLVDKVYAEHCFGLYGRNSFFIKIN